MAELLHYLWFLHRTSPWTPKVKPLPYYCIPSCNICNYPWLWHPQHPAVTIPRSNHDQPPTKEGQPPASTCALRKWRSWNSGTSFGDFGAAKSNILQHTNDTTTTTTTTTTTLTKTTAATTHTTATTTTTFRPRFSPKKKIPLLRLDSFQNSASRTQHHWMVWMWHLHLTWQFRVRWKMTWEGHSVCVHIYSCNVQYYVHKNIYIYICTH